MIKKNLFYNSLLSVSQFVFPLITFPYSSRILGPAGMGSVNFIDSFTQYFILFSALGIPLYGVREISKRKDQPAELAAVFNQIMLIHFVATCIFSIVFLTFSILTPALHAHLNIVGVGILMMFANVFMIEWFFQGIEKFRYITIRALIVRTLSVVFLFVFLKPGSDPVIYYGISASGFIITAALNMFFLSKTVKVRFIKSGLKQHLKPLSIILGSTLAVSVYLLMDNIILGFIKGNTAVGIYSTAVRIVKIPFAIIAAISSVIVPQVSKAYRDSDTAKIKLLIHKSFSFICVLGIPIAAGLFISSSFLVQKFAGNKFLGSILPVQILSPVILLVGLNNILGFQILTPFGKEKYLLRAVIIGMFFSLGLNLCLIPWLSFTGAAITNLLTECVVTFFCYIYVSKFISFDYDLKVIFQSIIGAGVFFPIAYLVRKAPVSTDLREIMVILSCGLFYVLYVWFFLKNSYVSNFKQLISQRLFSTKPALFNDYSK